MQKKTLDELFKATEDVTKQLHKEEMFFLYETVFHLPDDSIILEIGSFGGGSTVIMGTAIKDSSKKNTKIFAVDPFLGSSDHGNNVDTSSVYHSAITNHNVAQYITTISKTSEEAFKEWEFGLRLDFLWIDGGHEYDFVAKDIQLWNPYMNLNGKIALHDSSGEFLFGGFSGVRRAIKEFMFDHENFKDYGFVQSITYATKTNRITLEDWVKNRRNFYCWWIGKNDLSTHKHVAILLPLKMVGRYVLKFLRIFKCYWKN